MGCNDQNFFHLNGKVVVGTGAASSLGRKHVEAILQFSGVPKLLDIQDKKVRDLAFQLRTKYGAKVVSYGVDLTNDQEVEKSANSVFAEFGRVDGLLTTQQTIQKLRIKIIKNSQGSKTFLWKYGMVIWRWGLRVPSSVQHTLALRYPRTKNGVSLLNILSDLGIITPNQSLYENEGLSANSQAVKPLTCPVVKSGFIRLTFYLLTHWPHLGVRCNAICPGGINNGQLKKLFRRRFLTNTTWSTCRYQ
jgi:NAD(P)-dependent dehydrogenase (short-subunit alcohol dehydrogenase family)